jgi:alpha-mannosidase
MSISLLRSPTEPDPIADRGMHHFVYSFLPHAGNLTMTECPVLANAAIINQGVAMLEGVEGAAQLPVKVEGRYVDLSVVKKAEKEDCFVIRIAETSGHNTTAKLSSDEYPNARFVECDICEWNAYSKELANGSEVSLKPFEFKTFKVLV